MRGEDTRQQPAAGEDSGQKCDQHKRRAVARDEGRQDRLPIEKTRGEHKECLLAEQSVAVPPHASQIVRASAPCVACLALGQSCISRGLFDTTPASIISGNRDEDNGATIHARGRTPCRRQANECSSAVDNTCQLSNSCREVAPVVSRGGWHGSCAFAAFRPCPV